MRAGYPTLWAAILMVLAMAFLPAGAQAADPLAGLIGKKRVVLLFAKSRSDASSDRQISTLQERRAELEDRDVIAITVLGDMAIAAIGYASLPNGAGRELRRRFEPNAVGLTVVLVGKDGLEKGRWPRFVPADTLFDRIDEEVDAQADASSAARSG